MVKKSKISRAIDYEIESQKHYHTGYRLAPVFMAVFLSVVIAFLAISIESLFRK
jgi:hypothetical protein